MESYSKIQLPHLCPGGHFTLHHTGRRARRKFCAHFLLASDMPTVLPPCSVLVFIFSVVYPVSHSLAPQGKMKMVLHLKGAPSKHHCSQALWALLLIPSACPQAGSCAGVSIPVCFLCLVFITTQTQSPLPPARCDCPLNRPTSMFPTQTEQPPESSVFPVRWSHFFQPASDASQSSY